MPRKKMTPVRSVRVSDEVWVKAKIVAEANDTSVSEMIVGFLNRLRISKDIDVAARTSARKVNPVVQRRRFDIQTVTPPPARVSSAECDHKVTKTIPFGTFCCQCGSKMP